MAKAFGLKHLARRQVFEMGGNVSQFLSAFAKQHSLNLLLAAAVLPKMNKSRNRPVTRKTPPQKKKGHRSRPQPNFMGPFQQALGKEDQVRPKVPFGLLYSLLDAQTDLVGYMPGYLPFNHDYNLCTK